jgi:glutamate racemase
MSSPALHITYVDAWPEEGRGYNDLPDIAARARVFDRALDAIEAMAPDLVLIACNTLSIVYESTDHARHARTPVEGIVDAGVRLFAEALTTQRAGALVLVGTRTTIESGVHLARLVAQGVAADRIGAASCHGLATAIENGPASATTDALIAACAERAATAAPPGEPLHVGLCCTHYGIVGERFGAALERHAHRRIVLLDPNARLVDEVAAQLVGGMTRHEGGPSDHGSGGRQVGARVHDESAVGAIAIDVVSKVELTDAKREAFAAVLEPVSPATARALRDYRHVGDLF